MSLQFRSRKWTVNEGMAQESVLQQASLPIEKFKDPLIVFKNAPSYLNAQRRAIAPGKGLTKCGC